MLRLFMTLLVFLTFHSQARAAFTFTQIDFKKVIYGTSQKSSFEFKNLNSTPAILQLHGMASEGGRCRVTDYTKEPIFAGGSGYVHVQCSFYGEGFNSQTITTVTVNEKGSRSQVDLSYKALVYKDKVDAYLSSKQREAKFRASHCTNLDLNGTEPLKSIPVSDQDGTGMCYAHATSTLLQYDLNKKGIKRSVSTVDLGFVMKSITGKYDDTLNGGLFDTTVRDALSQGVVSKECVEKIIKQETQGTTMTSENFINLVNEIYKLKAKKKTNTQIETELKSICDSYGVDHNEFLGLINDLKVPLRTYFLKLLRPCEQERKQAKNWNINGFDQVSYGNDLDFVNKLDSVLNAKKPAGIALCAEILWGQTSHQGIIKPTRSLKSDAKGNRQCAAHAVVVTGRRNEGGTCQYLIRNSWGGSWKGKGLTCACKTPKNYYQNCNNVPKADAGNKVVVGCWMPEKALMDNTYIIGGLK